MEDEDDISNRIPRTKTLIKRSVSTTGLSALHSTNINLREAKSYTGPMDSRRSVDSLEKETDQGEILYSKQNSPTDKERKIETRDLVTNKPTILSENILNWQGRIYTLKDISYEWKKDCRMWLWKNGPDYKKNKSADDFGLKFK